MSAEICALKTTGRCMLRLRKQKIATADCEDGGSCVSMRVLSGANSPSGC